MTNFTLREERIPSPHTAKKFASYRKRFQSLVPPPALALVLDAHGMILHLTLPAQRLLEYNAEQAIDPSFFSHVHTKCLYQVMRDVADMVCHGKRKATWLLRLRTGQDRWQWYKASVKNELGTHKGIIVIHLKDLRDQ